MYYRSGTDKSASGQLADTVAYASGGRCMCTHQMAALLNSMGQIRKTPQMSRELYTLLTKTYHTITLPIRTSFNE